MVLAATVSLGACSETHAGVVSSYVPQMDALAAKWRRIADSIAGVPYVAAREDSRDAAPARPTGLVLDVRNPSRGNAEAVPFERLADPGCDAVPFDLGLARRSLAAFQWTRAAQRDSQTPPSDPKRIRETIEEVLRLRYLVVYERTEWTLPHFDDEATASLARVAFRAHVVDLFDERILTSFHVVSKAQDQPDPIAEAPSRGTLWWRARETFAEGLRDATGGDVRLGSRTAR